MKSLWYRLDNIKTNLVFMTLDIYLRYHRDMMMELLEEQDLLLQRWIIVENTHKARCQAISVEYSRHINNIISIYGQTK